MADTKLPKGSRLSDVRDSCRTAAKQRLIMLHCANFMGPKVGHVSLASPSARFGARVFAGALEVFQIRYKRSVDRRLRGPPMDGADVESWRRRPCTRRDRFLRRHDGEIRVIYRSVATQRAPKTPRAPCTRGCRRCGVARRPSRARVTREVERRQEVDPATAPAGCCPLDEVQCRYYSELDVTPWISASCSSCRRPSARVWTYEQTDFRGADGAERVQTPGGPAEPVFAGDGPREDQSGCDLRRRDGAEKYFDPFRGHRRKQ